MDYSSIFNPDVLSVGQAISIKYNNWVYELKQKGEDVLVLSLGEAFFQLPNLSFDDIPETELFHYSHSRGLPELRSKIASHFDRKYEVNFDPEKEIIISSGSKMAIYMGLRTILKPQDEVLFFEPAWVSYSEQIKMCSAMPCGIPYYETVYEIEKYLTEKTKCIILNNPNNPTGKLYTFEELSFIYAVAEKHDIFILSDEAYSDFVMDRNCFISMGKIDRKLKRTIICNSASKNFGISGWRIGYIIANERLIDIVLRIQQHLITCPATILQVYLSKHYDELVSHTGPLISKVVKKRSEILSCIQQEGIGYLPGDSTFYIFISILPSRLSSDEFCTRLLLEKRISAVPGIGYGSSCDRFIRISIGTETTERIKQGVKEIKEFIRNTQ